MADHGHSVVGFDKDATKVKALREEAEHRDIRGAASLKEFVGLLRVPRAVMMLVPAGPPVDCRHSRAAALPATGRPDHRWRQLSL
jgi:6-phosphogluconate dehydrogenase